MMVFRFATIQQLHHVSIDAHMAALLLKEGKLQQLSYNEALADQRFRQLDSRASRFQWIPENRRDIRMPADPAKIL